jgi:hypothetical protein
MDEADAAADGTRVCAHFSETVNGVPVVPALVFARAVGLAAVASGAWR